ncbi:hypothetical protein ETU08_03470 [Apibacter muscae]|uniref:hypothetical protein n=1 Tax=Apibacter muscae TaxID=2509004 RepID=UPI0011AC3190|nr:hypothetical protein [Apibacter muscae]TWP31079.1 hypothetical protein ETU08_03470 [Apibacter muscae]
MKIFSFILISIIIISCTRNNNFNFLSKDTSLASNYKVLNLKNISPDFPLDSLEMLTSEYGNFKFYSENTLRGEGVIALSINSEIEILNLDKSYFGSISLNKEMESYNINLPKVTIAREIIPDSEYQIFNFDSEQPNKNKDFLIIYLNKEPKLIQKNKTQYSFSSWDEYIKKSFIKLTPQVDNRAPEEEYLYKAIKIKEDSMLIKSVPKSACDYVEKYKNITKWIKWKSNNCKLIKFNFCY